MPRPHTASRWRPLVLAVLAALCAPARARTDDPELVPDPGREIRDACGGGGAAFRIASATLGQVRPIAIVLPESFARSAPQRRYPVTLVLDGEAYLAQAAAVSQELARHGLVPESILVAVENVGGPDERAHELTPPGLSVSGTGLDAGGDRFLDFLERELLPAVDRQFRGGLPRTLVGHSSGGVLAIWAAATRPSFAAVVAIDAPVTLGGNWLGARLRERARSAAAPLHFAYLGARFPWPDEDWNALVAVAPATWRLQREQLQHEAHESAFLLGAYLGLREVFADYSRLAAPVAPTTSILSHYEAVGAAYGASLLPPQRLLHDVVEDLLMEGRGAAARDAWDLLVAGYGEPPDGASLLQRIEEVERLPPPTETVEGLLATPFPTPEEAEAFLGEWKGAMWMHPDEPRRPAILRLEVRDGRVVAELEQLDAPPEYRITPLQYLKLSPAGLAFGFLNGMRPRGVIVHEGVLQGDTLAGTTRWGGISFRYPEGMQPPEPGFEFVRARR